MLGLVLAGSMVISMTSPVADAAAKMSLSKKKITITQGEKVTLKVKKATKKVKWSVTKGKKVIKLSKKKKADTGSGDNRSYSNSMGDTGSCNTAAGNHCTNFYTGC